MKLPLNIVLCRENPCNLINILGPFAIILQPKNFDNVEFIDTSSAGKTARKVSEKLHLNLSGSNQNSNHPNL